MANVKHKHPNSFIKLKSRDSRFQRWKSHQKEGTSPQMVKGSATVYIMGVEIRLLSSVKLTQASCVGGKMTTTDLGGIIFLLRQHFVLFLFPLPLFRSFFPSVKTACEWTTALCVYVCKRV